MSGTWNDILTEASVSGSTYDLIRRKYLKQFSEHRRRNAILYYSGWLQKSGLARDPNVNMDINDADKVGFMSVIKGLDRTKGLDLILHTPGGDLAATESLVDYLRAMFGTDICAFVPQLAMSAGTMVACACKEIWMGKQSSLGPIDPQMNQLPANAIIEEFNQAAAEIKADNSRALVWQPILSKLYPSALTQCQHAIKWGQEVANKWLETGMFEGRSTARDDAAKTVTELTSAELRMHARHINADAAQRFGLTIRRFEESQELQDAVLSVHHATVLTLSSTGAYKIIENQNGTAFILVVQQIPIVR